MEIALWKYEMFEAKKYMHRFIAKGYCYYSMTIPLNMGDSMRRVLQ
jgi:hypothetical protein